MQTLTPLNPPTSRALSSPPSRQALMEALRAAVVPARVGALLRSRNLAHPADEAVAEIREAAATAIAFRLDNGRDLLVSAPPVEAEFLCLARQAVSLTGVRKALELAGLVPDLHPNGVHAALTMELAGIARQAARRARQHGCTVCPDCVGVGAHLTTQDALLAAALAV